MKILDKYLIRTFIPPFFVAFGIALFVLVMQFLWVYVDELMGKGLGIFDLSELFFYLSMTMVPMALPIGVLLSTVMVMGNLAERYELSSFKSAGINLLRIMLPLILAITGIFIFSIFTSERIIPWANLKFYSRFYDIRKSKPTVSLETGVFNDEFRDYTLRIGKKSADGISIGDVLVYQNRGGSQNLINQTQAKSGEMMNTPDGAFMVMNLFDGVQFQETQGTVNSGQKSTYPFVRVKFKSWQKLFDLTQFDRQETDESMFKNHQKMQGSVMLWNAADSIRKTKTRYYEDLHRNMLRQFTPLLRKAETVIQPITSVGEEDIIKLGRINQEPEKANKTSRKKNEIIAQQWSEAQRKIDSASRYRLEETPFSTGMPLSRLENAAIVDTSLSKKLNQSFYKLTQDMPKNEWVNLRSRTESKIRNAQTDLETATSMVKNTEEQAGKFIYEMHMKYSLAAVCLVFLFIGAPMGAIVQKGGFGYPILIAISFFMVFMVSIIYCKNLKDSGDVSPEMAAWIPVFIMIPIALVLTYRAIHDYKLMNFDPKKLWVTFLEKLIFWRKQKTSL
jgi:lipopolysaccharide export system permease protein